MRLYDEEGNNLKIEILENQVAALKLIKRKQEILHAASNINTDRFDGLINTIEDVVARLRTIEQEQMESRKIEANSGESTKKVETMVMNTKANSITKDTSANIHKNIFKCDQ